MKVKNILAVAAAAAVTLTLSTAARAEDSLLPPRAKALIPRVMARDTQNEPDLVRSQPTGPAAKIAQQKVTLRAPVENAAKVKEAPLFTGNNPFRDTRPAQFEVAPVK